MQKCNRTIHFAFVAIAIIVMPWGVAFGDSITVTAGGYVKNMVMHAEFGGYSSFTDEIQGRLNTAWYYGDAFSAAIEGRVIVVVPNNNSIVPLLFSSVNSENTYNRPAILDVDRAWLRYTNGPVQITAGEQRIAWGTNLVWNVIDIFNPYNVLDFDYEERPAALAVRAQIFTGALTNVDVVWQPVPLTQFGVTPPRSIAAQFTTSIARYDVHVMAAKFDGAWAGGTAWVGGVAWAGDICGAGFRGEAKYEYGLGEQVKDSIYYYRWDQTLRQRAFNAALSLDYTFPSSLYLHLEAKYINLSRDPGGFSSSAYYPRWSNFFEVAYNISPLVRGDAIAIAYPDDGSFVVMPGVTWSVVTDIDLTFLAMRYNKHLPSGGMDNSWLAMGRVRWAF